MVSILVFSVVVLLVTALIVWAISNYLPGDPNIKNLACLAVILIAIVVILHKLGVF